MHPGIDAETIYKWLERKKLPVHKAGQFWKFMASEVGELVGPEKRRNQVENHEFPSCPEISSLGDDASCLRRLDLDMPSSTWPSKTADIVSVGMQVFSAEDLGSLVGRTYGCLS